MLNDMLDRNLMWSERRNIGEPGHFARPATRQSPEFSGIGCSGSRMHGLIHGLKDGRLRDLDCAVGPGHFQSETAQWRLS